MPVIEPWQVACRIGVLAYTDDAEGRLGLVDGKMRMSRETLRPQITLEPGANETRARELVGKAHGDCFIANLVSTIVEVAPTCAFSEEPVPEV